MTATRHQVLEYLKKVRTASAREIARALELEAPNVRHHLSLLVADGRAEITSSRKVYGKGRPEKLYSLSRAWQGHNLGGLASALLDETGSGLSVEALAKRMVGANGFAGQPAANRLAALVKRMNEMNYQARWEAGAEGPHILLGLCPYAEIIDAHPELCKLDAAMIEAMLGMPVEQRLRRAPACVFAG